MPMTPCQSNQHPPSLVGPPLLPPPSWGGSVNGKGEYDLNLTTLTLTLLPPSNWAMPMVIMT